MLCPPVPVSNSRYRVHTTSRPLGTGSFATVYAAEALSVRTTPAAANLPLVAKVTNLNNIKTGQSWKVEKHVYAVLNNNDDDTLHPHIVRCIDHYAMANQGVLILERFRGQTLQAHIEMHDALSPADVLHLLPQLLSALQHLHSKNIAVVDLKPENIAYDANTRTCKLFDFGLSTVLVVPDVPILNNHGSPLYMAPEVLRMAIHDAFMSDCWSLGQVLFTACMGRTMFNPNQSLRALTEEVRRCAFFDGVARYLVDVPQVLRAPIMGLCGYAPNERWGLGRVQQWLGERAKEAEEDTMDTD